MNERYSEKLKVNIIDFGPNDETTRESIAEEEVRRDLTKSGEQLLWDVHCEAMDGNRTSEENLIGANKRFASLMLRVIRSNDKIGREMQYLTWAIAIMTAVIVYFTWEQSHSFQPTPTMGLFQKPITNGMFFALLTPFACAVYLISRINTRDLQGWQHYACLTSLVILISILFLIGSGNVQSFNVAGNSVQLVDQKLNEVKALTQQNKLMAKQTVELINQATSGSMQMEGYDSKATYQFESNLLNSAGYSDAEIKTILNKAN